MVYYKLLLSINQRVFRNVVRGFSLVLRDPEGSHYENLEVKNLFDTQDRIKIKGRTKSNSL